MATMCLLWSIGVGVGNPCACRAFMKAYSFTARRELKKREEESRESKEE
jgi:hypothetical protein